MNRDALDPLTSRLECLKIRLFIFLHSAINFFLATFKMTLEKFSKIAQKRSPVYESLQLISQRLQLRLEFKLFGMFYFNFNYLGQGFLETLIQNSLSFLGSYVLSDGKNNLCHIQNSTDFRGKRKKISRLKNSDAKSLRHRPRAI